MSQKIYTTTATNTGGTHGSVSLSDGPTVQTGPPEDPAAGRNPEQFLAMSWATCLCASVEAALKKQGIDPEEHAPRVDVSVSLHRGDDGQFSFAPGANVTIEDLPDDQAREIAAVAHSRCPVSKLLGGQGQPVVRAGGAPL